MGRERIRGWGSQREVALIRMLGSFQAGRNEIEWRKDTFSGMTRFCTCFGAWTFRDLFPPRNAEQLKQKSCFYLLEQIF